MREQWYVDLDREYVSERFAAARRRIDNLKLDWDGAKRIFGYCLRIRHFHQQIMGDDQLWRSIH